MLFREKLLLAARKGEDRNNRDRGDRGKGKASHLLKKVQYNTLFAKWIQYSDCWEADIKKASYLPANSEYSNQLEGMWKGVAYRIEKEDDKQQHWSESQRQSEEKAMSECH